MPLYEYQCAKCGKVFEVIQKFSDAPLEVHEGCGGEVVKLLSAPAFHFKGSGWYATDYAKQSTSSPEKHEKPKNGEAKVESKSESTESKPDPKPAAKE
jgi:putative FmdB family regulatory protein